MVQEISDLMTEYRYEVQELMKVIDKYVKQKICKKIKS